MPKRKAMTKLSGLVGSDDEDVMQVDSAPDSDTERPVKRARGRPASKATENKLPPPMKTRSTTTTAESEAQEPAAKKKRGRPKGSGGRPSAERAEQEVTETEPKGTAKRQSAKAQEKDDGAVSDDDLQAAQDDASKATKNAKDAKPTTGRGRKKASAAAEKRVKTDGEFEYTPTPRKTKSLEKPKKAESPIEDEREVEREAGDTVPESQRTVADVIDETIIHEEPAPRRSLSPTKAAFHRSSIPRLSLSPQKRRAEDGKTSSEPELRRRLGDLTKKYDALENRYRNLREIGIIEANSNMEKLRKQYDAMTIGMCFPRLEFNVRMLILDLVRFLQLPMILSTLLKKSLKHRGPLVSKVGRFKNS